MPKTMKDKVQARSINAKSEGPCKRGNPAGTYREQSPDLEELPFTQLGAKIVKLSEFIKDKHNVHQAIKNMVRVIRVLYNRSQEEKNNKDTPNPAVPTVSQATQVAPNRTTIEFQRNKRVREKEGDPVNNQQAPKRKKGGQDILKTNTNRPEGGNRTANLGNSTSVAKPKTSENDGWTKVTNKKAERKAKVRTRPDVIVISSKGNLSYAEILKKVKADPDLKDLSGNVNRIRRTPKGEGERSSMGKTDDFRTQVKNSLGENAAVRAQKHQIYLQCKDLDEVTSKGEICTALKEQFKLKELTEESVVGLRKAYGGTQTATIRVPAEAAQMLLAAGRQEESTDTFQPPLNLAAIPLLDELLDICGRIGDNKAPGLHGVPNKALKLAVKSRPDMFTELFEACMSEGIFPVAWKRQKLVLLPKPGKPPGEPSSYRPICLLDTVGKMLERVIYNRLLPVVESQGGLSDRQYRFRKARSTIDAIKLVTGLAEDAIHGKGSTSKYCVVVTLDVKNAFNSTTWKSLAKVGIPAYLAAIVDSYLTERRFWYDTDDGPQEHVVSAGVLQGSVLGPLLWNIM
ncbi:unnamed protein product [Hermetia illucens]|uniref:Reverse transcriptase domain-containing protein n=1 Tax=Hermetia illucens TaxID=343691 RepID=A0A7R8UG23_HERIL|nr:unnamed protein product [Hermetia illucens]